MASGHERCWGESWPLCLRNLVMWRFGDLVMSASGASVAQISPNHHITRSPNTTTRCAPRTACATSGGRQLNRKDN
jgi:hypothetical protein